MWKNHYKKIKIPRDKSCPSCNGFYEYLESKDNSEYLAICGDDAIQYRPRGKFNWDLNSLRVKLLKLGKVKLTGKILKFENQDDEILLFEDGRMILYGIKDLGRVKSTYSKYVGL